MVIYTTNTDFFFCISDQLYRILLPFCLLDKAYRVNTPLTFSSSYVKMFVAWFDDNNASFWQTNIKTISLNHLSHITFKSPPLLPVPANYPLSTHRFLDIANVLNPRAYKYEDTICKESRKLWTHSSCGWKDSKIRSSENDAFATEERPNQFNELIGHCANLRLFTLIHLI